jgi:hypothetical protein
METEEGASQSHSERHSELPEAEGAPRPDRKRKKYVRWLLIITAILSVSVVTGSFLIVQVQRVGRTTQATSRNTTPVSECAAPIQTPEFVQQISGLTENDIWAIRSDILHWDGVNWSTVFQSGAGQNFRDIVEIAPNNVWAIGARFYSSDWHFSTTLIVHWDGVHWNIVDSPNVMPATNGYNILTAISVASANDIWTVGIYGLPLPSYASAPLIEHWNGQNWSRISIPGTSLSNTLATGLSGVKALNSRDVWMVGSTGDNLSDPLIEHWDGTRWSAMTSPNLDAFGGGSLLSIDGSSTNDMWAVGFVGAEDNGLLIEHWDGTTWSLALLVRRIGDYYILHEVAVVSPDDVWAIGEDQGEMGHYPVIEDRDGLQWLAFPNHTQSTMASLRIVGHQARALYGADTNAMEHPEFIETLCT